MAGIQAGFGRHAQERALCRIADQAQRVTVMLEDGVIAEHGSPGQHLQ